MGKIRIKTLGDLPQEQEEKKKIKVKREEKKKAHVAGMKGGERTVIVGPTEEEVLAETPNSPKSPALPEGAEAEAPKKKAKFKKEKVKSRRYLENAALVGKNKTYTLSQAIELLKKFKTSSFDETLELHVNVKEKGFSGQVALPHGTGKARRIKIADDQTITDIEKGEIDFDVLVATPQMMPKLAKVAKILGPRGLMPNPKAGTVTDKPEAAVEKLAKGQVNYKTEPEAPIIHMAVGKVSFEDDKIKDNVETVLASVGTNKINSATLKSTMSPGIKLNIA